MYPDPGLQMRLMEQDAELVRQAEHIESLKTDLNAWQGAANAAHDQADQLEREVNYLKQQLELAHAELARMGRLLGNDG
jgi:chromosome segregation ATPase